MLLWASSPYARRGALWDAYRRCYGKDDPSVLVWRAPTVTMNPSVPQRVIDEAFEADPVSAAAEYGAEFRTDVERYISREAVEVCVSLGVRERPPFSPVDRLEARAKRISERGAAMLNVAEAAKPLYASLDDTQNRLFGMLGGEMLLMGRGQQHRGMGPMGGMGKGMMGGGMGMMNRHGVWA